MGASFSLIHRSLSAPISQGDHLLGTRGKHLSRKQQMGGSPRSGGHRLIQSTLSLRTRRRQALWILPAMLFSIKILGGMLVGFFV